MTVAGDEPKAKELLTKQADWARLTNQLQDAAQMYMAAGDYLTAIEIIARNDWVEMCAALKLFLSSLLTSRLNASLSRARRLVDVSRKIDKGDREALQRCAFHLRRLGQHPYAADCYVKLGDYYALLRLYIDVQLWQQVCLCL